MSQYKDENGNILAVGSDIPINGSIATESEINAFDLKNSKELKKKEIKEIFKLESINPVEVNGILHEGGRESALNLDGKRRMIIESGGSIVNLFDYNDVVQSYTLEEALNVVLTISQKYEDDFVKYKTLKKEIEDAENISEVETITW